MSNTEETPESSSRKRSSLIDEFLESGRKKARKSLSTDDKHIEDLEYMLKSVKALVKIINEIWGKCKKRLALSLAISKNNNSPFTFQRRIFKEVKVKKKGKRLIITTKLEKNTKDFGSLPAVPEDLSNLVCFGPPESESEILPDYNNYLEKSSILCEDVLLPFLTGFKEHLENVQVYLGQIEAWLLEPEIIYSFLKKTFNGPGYEITKKKKDSSKFLLYGSYCLDVDSRMKSKYNLCTEEGREVLKATLNYIKVYKPVTHIEVKGAGEEAVNGTYTIYEQYNSVYGYTRSGLWDGKPVTFYLVRNQNKKKWWLSCENENQLDDLVPFYWTKGTGEENELPPLNEWNMEGNGFHGVNPPPQILYKVDD